MATIEKMSIRGIRNFGTGPDDEQQIKFSSPLTLILGSNGCGKTTIIECLKYALTGELPPGCGQGRNFLHDPKLHNNTQTLGQIRLQIQNSKNDKLTVNRSMRYYKKNNAFKFETLDATVTMETNGKMESISKRCFDVNKEMAMAMGVSNAIINNVLFCHQEDSDWPLDSGKKLKEKFDEIFGTAENNRAIDRLIKMRKEYELEAKMKEGDLKLLLHIKVEVDNKHLALNKYKEELTQCQEKRDRFDKELKPIKERIIKINTLELDISKLQTEKIQLTSNLKNSKDRQSKLMDNIKNLFDGNMIALDREIRQFKDRIMERTRNLSDCETDLSDGRTNEKRLQAKLTGLERERGTLIYQREQEQDLLSDRAKLIGKFAKSLNISIDSNLENTNENVIDHLKQLKSALKMEEEKFNEMSESYDLLDAEKQQQIDKLRESKVSIESNITAKKKQIADLKQDQSKIKRQIDDVEQSAEQLQQITDKVAEFDQKLEHANAINLDEKKQTIDAKRQKRNQLQDDLDKIDKQITFLNSISKITAEIAAKQTHLESRESEVRKLRNKHGDNFRRLLNNEQIESNYKRRIQTIQQHLQREIANADKNINQNQQKIIQLDMTRKNQRDELSRMERDLQAGEDKLYEHCHSLPYDEVLLKVKENVEKYQFDHGTLKSSELLYKKYIEKMESEPCCPLCHKDMTQNDVTDLSAELQDEIRRLPENIQRAERILKKENEKYESLIALQPITENLQKLRSTIPEYKLKLKTTEEQLSNARNEQEMLQISLAEPKSNFELVNSMQGDMSLLDEGIKDVQRLKDELNAIKSKLPTRPDDCVQQTMDEAQQEKTEIAHQLKCETKDLDSVQEQYNKEMNEINKLREQRNKLKTRQIQLQEGVQALSQLKTRQKELFDKCTAETNGLHELQMKLEPASESLRVAIVEKETERKENGQKLSLVENKLKKVQSIDGEINRCTDELNKLAKLNLVKVIDKMENDIKKIMQEQKEKITENERISKQIEQLRQEIAGQQSVERELHDNKELMDLKSKSAKLQERLDELTKDMGDMDFSSISREKDDLIERQERIVSERSKYVGQMNTIKNNIEQLDKELLRPNYQNALKNYREAEIDAQILKRVCIELSMNRKCMEIALLNYHTEKMVQVNRLIRQYWRSIYRGNDIDYIEIKTDEDKKPAADKRRSYEYRVVQIKHDVELDMTGRCSAGQRVLACLVIRMALAEAFSNCCGILALDEPTTNLDRDNILSLCEALNEVVEQRQTQRNFMLIVITHDEDFITSLGKVMHYHKVTRNLNGKSVITKVRVN